MKGLIIIIKLTDIEFERMTTYLYNNYGINLKKKRTLIEGRLNRTLIEGGYKDYTSYLNNVFGDRSGAEVQNLINKLTTNHTFFMREIEHFNYLKSVVLPQIEQTSRNKEIRIWSAGCSSGEEPYTLAMVLDDYFGTKKSLWKTKILATDISMRVLSKAQEGIYAGDGMKDIPTAWKAKYFTKGDGDTYKISPKIRNEVEFKEFNLMKPILERNPFDLILCRNVMIYFDQTTRRALVERFYDVTKPGGYLFIGHAESIMRGTSKYNYVKPAIYRK